MQSLQINKNKCLESYSSKHKSRILHQTLSSTVSVDPLYVYVQAYILKFHAPVKGLLWCVCTGGGVRSGTHDHIWPTDAGPAPGCGSVTSSSRGG